MFSHHTWKYYFIVYFWNVDDGMYIICLHKYNTNLAENSSDMKKILLYIYSITLLLWCLFPSFLWSTYWIFSGVSLSTTYLFPRSSGLAGLSPSVSFPLLPLFPCVNIFQGIHPSFSHANFCCLPCLLPNLSHAYSYADPPTSFVFPTHTSCYVSSLASLAMSSRALSMPFPQFPAGI